MILFFLVSWDGIEETVLNIRKKIQAPVVATTCLNMSSYKGERFSYQLFSLFADLLLGMGLVMLSLKNILRKFSTMRHSIRNFLISYIECLSPSRFVCFQ